MTPRSEPRIGRRASPGSRDQSESPFARILSALVHRVPGARAAALVDVEGETVDYAGGAAPFDVRVSAAELRIVLQGLHARFGLTSVRWLIVAASRGSYLVYALPEGYALVLLLGRGAGFSGWQRALVTCAAELTVEARWPSARLREPLWEPASVLSDADGRPRAIHAVGQAHPLEILGRIIPSKRTRAPESGAVVAAPERGWRVRLAAAASWVELNLVREPGGNWYVDEGLKQALSPPPDQKNR